MSNKSENNNNNNHNDDKNDTPHHHSAHSKTLPQIDLSKGSWTLPTARKLSTQLALVTNGGSSKSLTHTHNHTFSANDSLDLDLMDDVKDHIDDQHNIDHNMDDQHHHIMTNSHELNINSHIASYQDSPPNSVASHSSVSIDRSSPSSLLLHQSAVTTFPNIPSLNLSGSNAPEENVYCEISPKFSTNHHHNYNNSNISSISLQHNQVLQYSDFVQIRDASKSEPPYPSFHKNQNNKDTENNNNKKNGHNKSNTSVSLQRMNQPPRASNLIQRGHSGRSPSNISASSLSLNSNYNNPPPQAVKSPIHHPKKIEHVHSRSHHLSNITINKNGTMIPSARELKLRKANSNNSNQIYKHGTPTPNRISMPLINDKSNIKKKIIDKSYNRSSTSPTIKTNTTQALKQKKNSFKRSKTSGNEKEKGSVSTANDTKKNMVQQNDINTNANTNNNNNATANTSTHSTVSAPKTNTVRRRKKTSNKRKNNHVHFKSTNSNKKQQNKPLPSPPPNSSKSKKIQSSPGPVSNSNKAKTTKGNSPTPKRKSGRKNPKLLTRSTTSPTHTISPSPTPGPISASPSPSPSISPLPQPSSPTKTKRNKGIQKRKQARTEREILNGSASTPTSTKSGHVPSLTFTTANPNMMKKLAKSKRGPIKRSETPQPIYTNSDSNETVRVMRDKEVLQIDEEIPIENFVSALRKGYARIMTDEQQAEEYKKSVRIARSVSVGNMQAYKDEILAEEELKKKGKRYRNKRRSRKRKKSKSKNKMKDRKRRYPKSRSSKNTPKVHEPRRKKIDKNGNGNDRQSRMNRAASPTFRFDSNLSRSIPPKIIQADDRFSSSDSDDSTFGSLVSPPLEIATANVLNIKPVKRKYKKVKSIKRAQTAHARRRSKTAQSPEDAVSKAMKFPYHRRRQRPNHNYANMNRLVTQPSKDCPTSPTIPEEDDILDTNNVVMTPPYKGNLGMDEEDMSTGNSSCGFDTDSDSESSSTDHACEMAKPVYSRNPSDKKKTPPTTTTNKPFRSKSNAPDSPALTSAAKSCNNLLALSNVKSQKFRVISKNIKAHSHGDEDDPDDLLDLDDVASPSESDDESHENSLERLIGAVTSDLDGIDMSTGSDTGLSSIGSGNHLTTSMYTKIQHNNSSPLQLPIVDEMKQKELTPEPRKRSYSDVNKEQHDKIKKEELIVEIPADDDDDVDDNQELPLPQTKMRKRSDSNSSISSTASTSSTTSSSSNDSNASSSSSSSSSGSSSDWDDEVREEETNRNKKRRWDEEKGTIVTTDEDSDDESGSDEESFEGQTSDGSESDDDSDSDNDDDDEEDESELHTSSDSSENDDDDEGKEGMDEDSVSENEDEDEDKDVDKIPNKPPKFSPKRCSLELSQSNSSTARLKQLYESHSDIEDEDAECTTDEEDSMSTNDKSCWPVRPQSTPFRSSKGTAVFLSNLSRYRKDQLNGKNLNELINGRPKQINTNIVSHSIAALSKSKIKSATTKKKVSSSMTPKTINNTKRDRQKSFTFDKTVNNKNNNVRSKRKINRRVHYNIQKKKNPIAAPTQIQTITKRRSKTFADKYTADKFIDNPTGYGSPIPLKIKKKNSTQITKNKKNKFKSVQKRKDANTDSIKKVSV